MRRSLLIVLILSGLLAHAQLIEVPISPSGTGLKKAKTSGARTHKLEALPLPFWDDFSFTQEKDFPNDTLWTSSKSVWVNHGRAINPPSIYTATFDGIDSTGKPYSVTELLAKGFADRLVSRPIRLDQVPAIEKESVYISFFYQVTGLGESPDRDDNLSLWFKDTNDSWEKVFEIQNNVILKTDSFYYAMVKVEPSFQHDNFQFRFQNFARLSGPYDAWNLDYVFLNSKRTAGDYSFPDRTIAKPFTSILGSYRAIPIKHLSYKDTASTVLVPPVGWFGNLYHAIPEQPTNYYTWASVYAWNNGIRSEKNFFLDSADVGFNIRRGEITEVLTAKTIPKDSIDLDADSVVLRLKMSLKSGDEDYIAGVTERFEPTNFFLNDTTVFDFILRKYYAYDDGTAEYGAGLNTVGMQMAYGFPMVTKEIDTLVAVDLYFPEFGSRANQTVILKVWSSTGDGKPMDELSQQTVPVERTQFNEFKRHKLEPALLVQGKFFIGWQQTATVMVPIGLDKNSDSGDEIYFKIGEVPWAQNQNVEGNLMIRPVFGNEPVDPITGLDKEPVPIYPNPSSGEFYIAGKAENISIISMLGTEQSHGTIVEESRTKVSVRNPAAGLFLIRWQQNGNIHTCRLLFRNN